MKHTHTPINKQCLLLRQVARSLSSGRRKTTNTANTQHITNDKQTISNNNNNNNNNSYNKSNSRRPAGG